MYCVSVSVLFRLLQRSLFASSSSNSTMALIIRNPTTDIAKLVGGSIQKAIFDRCALTDHHAKLLREALSDKTCSLQVLYMFGRYSSALRSQLCQGLAANTSIVTLYICGDASLSIKNDLGPALAQNKTLQELHLWDNQLGDDDVNELAEYLTHNTSIQKLHIPRNNITNADALIAVASTLSSALRELHLSYNQLESVSLVSLVPAATPSTHHHLTCLHLDGNLNLDISSLIKSLANNNNSNNLQQLNLTKCNLTEESLLQLISSLNTNTSLQELQIARGNNSSTAVRLALENLLQNYNKTLTSLDDIYTSSSSTASSPKMIAHYLDYNKSGRQLLSSSVPLGLWPHVLSSRAITPCIVYEFVSAKPEWCDSIIRRSPSSSSSV